MTIPGFTPAPGYSIQNHIHLGAVPYTGSPSGFGAHGEPPYKFGHVEERTPVFDTMSDFQRAWDGTPFEHVLRTTDNTSPVTFYNLRYKVRTDQAGMDILRALWQRRVYLVDSIHCPDASDHTPYVRVMWFQELTYSEHLDPVLDLNELQLTFMDMSTVSPL